LSIIVPSKLAQLSLLDSDCDENPGTLEFLEAVAVGLVEEEVFKFLFKAVEAQLSVSPKPLSEKFVLAARSWFIKEDWKLFEVLWLCHTLSNPFAAGWLDS